MDKLTDMDLIDKFDKLSDYLSNHIGNDNEKELKEMGLVKQEMQLRGLVAYSVSSKLSRNPL